MLRIRAELRQEELDLARRRTPQCFADHLAPDMLAWFVRSGHLPDIEEAWLPRLRARLRKYDLEPREWAAMIVRLESRCQICLTRLPPLRLHIDHDHYTNQVRGLLCSRCNTGIGMLRIDGPGGLERAAAVRAYMGLPNRLRRVKNGSQSQVDE